MFSDELRIRVYPDEVLRKKGVSVEKIDDQLVSFIEEMKRIMRAHNGIGLAARQVGLPYNFFIVDLRPNNRSEIVEMINPVILKSEGVFEEHEEGCLSVPGYYDVVKDRRKGIRVRYLDVNGEERIMDTDEFLSVVIQHELDHLNGILFIDHLSLLKREWFKRKWRKLER